MEELTIPLEQSSTNDLSELVGKPPCPPVRTELQNPHGILFDKALFTLFLPFPPLPHCPTGVSRITGSINHFYSHLILRPTSGGTNLWRHMEQIFVNK